MTLSKRSFFARYLSSNLENMLKRTSVGDKDGVKDVVWLFEASLRSMVDDESFVAKFERFLMLADRLEG